MNIFTLSEDPFVAAKMLCNKHISRMPLESMGMLMYAFPENSTPVDNSYKGRHYKHPASIWARHSAENFKWLLNHAIEQCIEYTKRYKRTHDSEKHIVWILNHWGEYMFNSVELTPFARCFSTYKELLDSTIPNTIEAYREFYKLDKENFAKWPSLDAIPHWWIEKSEKYVDKNFVNGNYTKR